MFQRGGQFRPRELVTDGGGHHLLQGLFSVILDRAQLSQEGLPFAADERDKDRLFVGKVLIERPDADPGAFSDPVGVQRVRILRFQNASRSFDNRGAGFDRAALLR